MLSSYLLYGLYLGWATLALSLPQDAQQQPLLLDQQRNKIQPHAMRVMLEFTESGNSMERRFEIPLRTRISSGVLLHAKKDPNTLLLMICLDVDLPRHLNIIRIVAAVTEQGQSTSLEELDAIICQVTPEISVEEKVIAEAGIESKVWPWFTITDGRVRFEDASSRWFLGGRTIESYECR
jgi:hypothetical protein